MARMKRKTTIRIPPLPSPSPMPKSGVISTIGSAMRKARPAEKFVKIRERINKLGGYAMGGEASEGVAKAGIRKGIRDRKRKELMDSLERLKQKGPRIKPKKKPKKGPGTIKPKLGLPPKSRILNLDIGNASSDQIKSAIQILQDRLKENK